MYFQLKAIGANDPRVGAIFDQRGIDGDNINGIK